MYIFLLKPILYILCIFHSALQVAFSVARTTNLPVIGLHSLPFEIFTVNLNSPSFRLEVGDVYMSRSGIYFSHISATSYPANIMETFISVESLYRSVLQVANDPRDTYYEPATCGRAYMANIALNGWCIYASRLPVYSDGEGLQTSWSMFRLDDLFLPLVAFSVSSSDGNVYSGPRVLPFDIIHVNQGNGWNGSIQEFFAPVSGIYVLSLATHTYANSGIQLDIQVNNVSQVAISVYNTQQYADTYTQSFLLQLHASDAVRAYLQSGSVENFGREGINFVGFLYEPVHGMSIAWSVYRTTSAVGPMDPVDFDYVMANVGCGWNNSTSTFTVPISGVYYLHINAGKVGGKKSNLQVMWNGNPYVNMFTEYTYDNGIETRGRAIMTNLTLGDSLHVKLWNGTELYSDTFKQTSFSGFLLYPN